jgi:uncharacterized protein YndB with AHSA1/START domain
VKSLLKLHDIYRGGKEEATMKTKHALIHDTFTLERRYTSSPAKVYRYFSEAQYRKCWFGSTEDWSQRSHSLDFRVRG